MGIFCVVGIKLNDIVLLTTFHVDCFWPALVLSKLDLQLGCFNLNSSPGNPGLRGHAALRVVVMVVVDL